MKTILLDMDGVLVDFHKGVFELLEIPMPKVLPDVGFDIYKAVHQLKPGLNLTVSQFWELFDHDFYVDLDWTQEGRVILEHAENLAGPDVFIMTSDIFTIGCTSGKVQWIQENMPDYKRKYLIGAPKFLAAHSHTMLVDDKDKNCEWFRDRESNWVLVPRPWNKLRHASDQCLELTLRQMEAVYNGMRV